MSMFLKSELSFQKTSFALAAPFFLVLLLNFNIWSHDVYHKTDATAFLFGTALNVYSGEPLKVWHLPGYLWSEISAAFLLITGSDVEDLKTFNLVGVAFQWVVVGFSVLWGAFLACRERFSIFGLFAFSSIFAFMPAALAYSSFWGHNFPVSALLLPIGLTLYIGFTRRNLAYSYWFLALLVLAAISANFFIGLAMPVGLIISALVLSSKELFSVKVHQYFWIIFSLNAVFLALVLYYVRENTAAYFGESDKWWWAYIFLWCVWTLMEAVSWKFKRPVSLLILPLWLGFLLGVNQFIPYWFYSFLQAGRGSGGAVSESDADSSLNFFTVIHESFQYGWSFLILLVPIAFILLILKKKMKSLAPLLVFSTCSLALTLFFVYKPWSFAFSELGVGLWGLSPYRYALFLPLVFGVLFLVLQKILSERNKLLALIIIFCTSSNLYGYLNEYQSYLLHTESVYNEIERECSKILNQSQNVIVVNRVLGVPWGAVSYGYNSYRTDASLAAISKRSWLDGKIHYSDWNFNEENMSLEEFVRKHELLNKSIYVIADYKIYDDQLSVVYYDEPTDLRISLVSTKKE